MKTEEEIKLEKESQNSFLLESKNALSSKYGMWIDAYHKIKDSLPKELHDDYKNLISFYSSCGTTAALEWVLKESKKQEDYKVPEIPYDLEYQLNRYHGMDVHGFNGALGRLRNSILAKNKKGAQDAILLLKKYIPTLSWSDSLFKGLK